MNLLAELWRYLKLRKKYWLVPIFLVILMLGGLLVLVQGSVIAPFIYTMF